MCEISNCMESLVQIPAWIEKCFNESMYQQGADRVVSISKELKIDKTTLLINSFKNSLEFNVDGFDTIYIVGFGVDVFLTK